MKTPNHPQFGESDLTIMPVNYAVFVREDRALQRKNVPQNNLSSTADQSICEHSKQKVRALTELIIQLPEGAAREILSEALTAIINGEGDIKRLRALTVSAARQLRTMYLSGGETALAADARWKVHEYAFKNFGIQLSIGPRGLHLAEGQSAEDFNAFLKIEANGHVWAGETYEDAPQGPLTEPLTTEDVLQRISEKLLRAIY
jgi:hypothetical protein